MKFVLAIIFLFSSNIYSQNSLIVKNINITGNKKTKNNVIVRELPFKTGDTIKKSQLDLICSTAERNLMRTGLFHAVDIEYEIENHDIDFYVILKELWYLWPLFSVIYADPNFSAWLSDPDIGRLSLLVGAEQYNFRSRGEKLKFYIQAGYTNKFFLDYNGLYFDSKRRHSWGVFFNYAERTRLAVKIEDYKLSYYDFDKIAFKNYTIGIKYSFRPILNTKHKIELNYLSYSVDDSVTLLNNSFLQNKQMHSSFLKLKYSFKFDSRDNINYPLQGKLLKINFIKYGLHTGLDSINALKIHEEFTFWSNWKPKEYFAIKFSHTKLLGEQPFILNNWFGWESYFSGYELNVIQGKSYYSLKLQFKHNVLQEKKITLEFVPVNELTYFSYRIFCGTMLSTAYVSSEIKGALTNRLIGSFTFFTDFVFDSYQAISLQLSLNDMLKFGIYLHLELPL